MAVLVRFDIVTLFPEMFQGFLSMGLMAKAVKGRVLEVNFCDLTQVAPFHGVDDRPYGGGDGLILAPEPLGRALEKVVGEKGERPLIYLSPQGRRFDFRRARRLAAQGGAVLLCGRYGGVDERILELYVDEEISIGDYVLMGGELPAMVVMEAVTRFLPGVLGNNESVNNDSFETGLLEAPQYTRPQEFRGLRVPEVLLSGDHEAIRVWRSEAALKRTRERRPDLEGGLLDRKRKSK